MRIVYGRKERHGEDGLKAVQETITAFRKIHS
jgi:hypothetical protein